MKPTHPDIEEVYALISADDYSTAEKVIERLRAEGSNLKELLLYEAVCAYERSDDVRCLHFLAAFLKKAPRHPKRNYAVFTACVSLINLGLYSKASSLLQLLSPSYPARAAELVHVRSKLDKQEEASNDADAIYTLLSNA